MRAWCTCPMRIRTRSMQLDATKPNSKEADCSPLSADFGVVASPAACAWVGLCKPQVGGSIPLTSSITYEVLPPGWRRFCYHFQKSGCLTGRQPADFPSATTYRRDRVFCCASSDSAHFALGFSEGDSDSIPPILR